MLRNSGGCLSLCFTALFACATPGSMGTPPPATGTAAAAVEAVPAPAPAPAPEAASPVAPPPAEAGSRKPEAPTAEPDVPLLDPTAGEHAIAQAESGGDSNEDAAPEGVFSRASGRPDHARTLAEIKASGYIRVLTRNNDTSFFIYRGHRMGFDYELGKRLAQRLGIRVDMVITQEWNEMVPALLRGEGDAIAAEMTVTDERKSSVLFAEPWGKTRQMIVWKDGSTPIKTVDDIAGKEVHVRAGSVYHHTLLALNERFVKEGKLPMKLQLLPADTETEAVLASVSRGEYLYTVSDGLLADIHQAYYDNLQIGPAVSDEQDLAWAVRPADTQLKNEIDALLREMKKKPDLNILKKKYFEADRDFKKERKDKFYASETGTLSPYDPLVIKYSQDHDFDWRLVAAQIYQESHFDPQRKSWVGALGLFQIMPATAKGLGIIDPTDPEQSIRGGLKYMEQLSKHYSEVADAIERYRFALAAYNTGFGHVDDARKLARLDKKDAALWKNVAPYLLKLSNRQYAARARFGYCRGIEPVDYVRHIDERYTGYSQLVPLAPPAPKKPGKDKTSSNP